MLNFEVIRDEKGYATGYALTDVITGIRVEATGVSASAAEQWMRANVDLLIARVQTSAMIFNGKYTE